MDNAIKRHFKHFIDENLSAIDICNSIIAEEAQKIEKIMFAQVEDEEGEPVMSTDTYTAIPEIEKANHTLDVLKEAKKHLEDRQEWLNRM